MEFKLGLISDNKKTNNFTSIFYFILAQLMKSILTVVRLFVVTRSRVNDVIISYMFCVLAISFNHTERFPISLRTLEVRPQGRVFRATGSYR